MADLLTVDIVTPDQLVLSIEAKSVTIPGSLGEMQVLPNHLPVLTTMRAGSLIVVSEKGEEIFAVSDGFVEVLPDQITVLAQTCEGEFDIDIERAQRAAQRARDRLADLGSENVEMAFSFQTALERALARIEVWNRTHDD